MTGAVVACLLALGVVAVLLSAIGIVSTWNPWDQLHFTGLASVVGPIALAAAVLVEEPLSSASVKAVLTALVLLVTSPVVVHATARAGRIREHGRFVIRSREAERRERPSRRSKP